MEILEKFQAELPQQFYAELLNEPAKKFNNTSGEVPGETHEKILCRKFGGIIGGTPGGILAGAPGVII